MYSLSVELNLNQKALVLFDDVMELSAPQPYQLLQ